MSEINKIREELNLSNDDIASMFGYKNGGSYSRAARKKQLDQGIVALCRLKDLKYIEKMQPNNDKSQADIKSDIAKRLGVASFDKYVLLLIHEQRISEAYKLLDEVNIKFISQFKGI